ncbi:MAG: diphosphomevalonate decarboxylase [Saprospiraceae bacterium]
MNEFLIPSSNPIGKIKSGHIAWRSPSNIALVKYWGKYGQQLPANPSLSMTLEHAYTETHIFYKPGNVYDEDGFKFNLDSKPNQKFEIKLKAVFQKWKEYFPFLEKVNLEIHSKNSFPHSAGIASSASGMSALALCLVSLEQLLYQRFTDKEFFQKASYMSRLASGSACRSIYPCFSIWGRLDHIPNSHDAYAIAYERFHPVFASLHDDILIVSGEEKKVSSTDGHALMNDNPYAETRYAQARKNTEELALILRSGDLHRFGEIIEAEALTLHALMMCSNPGYILMHPNTLNIISKIKEYRKATGYPIYFSLDAGPNPHVFYPDEISEEAEKFINAELKKFTENGNILKDKCGTGPVQIN